MIFAAISRALAQAGDPTFRGVLLRGLGLTLALLVAMAAGMGWLVGWLVPDTVSLPLVGELTFLDSLASGLSVLGVLALSTVLMVPVASAFTGIFLDDVAAAVEARHYPDATARPAAPILSAIADSLRFLGVIVLANLCALVLYLMLPPAAPLIFWGLNGFLLGREYFMLAALRHLDEPGARRLRRRHGGRIWLAGAIMAVPLTVPVLNLVVPVLGAATFTHLFHRLDARG
ncbi:EI24 domain-containing protein [Meridianimarinicoccus sp. RP-17]|uniref:EI24 domain-containing protein n=1 Tax=Meridianimarinicoccus zhengii TaxID=2056810 RepID=UPI000DAD8B5E|nr:EI24 domain-containing protein [Phycocomes zhengii]